MAPVYDKEEEAVCLHRAELFLAARGKVDFFSEVDVFEQPVALAIEEQMLVDRDTARDFEQVAALDQWLAQQMFDAVDRDRSEEHTYELQPLMRITFAVFCLKQKQHFNHGIVALVCL